MKLAKLKQCKSRFRVPYKMYKDDQTIPQDFQLVSNDAYLARFQYSIFEDGNFDYSDNILDCIIASINDSPFVFVIDGPFITQQIPFQTKVDVNNGHIFMSGIFAVQKSNLDRYDELKIQFQRRVKSDLIENIDKQIEDLKKAKQLL